MSDFDPAKETKNLIKHQVSLSRWIDLIVLAIVHDDRFDYGEPRYRAYGLLDDQFYCLVFTIRDGAKRPISLRRARAKEMKRHVP